ncbi:Zn(2)-C6 fungal-type DNA-binding domain [Phaffia rhodozyma]|uniref:Zn(2)-C6 fungal-type DNA-binding domain n=1 Tax=Phaffia rhodozyma TaxID=264483 RepID=A0A0F7SPG8_PHARH|nr:Zn(2)-C6 fungal-type DNA-binding domain [Phaffia rhodozyma]
MSSAKRKAMQALPSSPPPSAAAVAQTQSSASKDREREKKRTKVQIACVFCKRSHMVCSNERPCERCVRRGIQHLCTDLDPSTLTTTNASDGTVAAATATTANITAASSSSSSGVSLNAGKKSRSQQVTKPSTSSSLGSSSSASSSSASPPPKSKSCVSSFSRTKHSLNKPSSQALASNPRRPSLADRISSSSSTNEISSDKRRLFNHQASLAGPPPFLPPIVPKSMGSGDDQVPSIPQEDQISSLQQQQQQQEEESNAATLPELRQHQQRNPLNKAFPPQSIAHQLQSKHNPLSSQLQPQHPPLPQSYPSAQRPSISPQIYPEHASGGPRVGQPDSQQAYSLLSKATSIPNPKPLRPPSPNYSKPVMRTEETMIDPSLAPSPIGMTPIASPWNGIGTLTPRTSEALGVSRDKGLEEPPGDNLVPTLASSSGYKDAEWGSLSEFLNTLEFPSSLLPLSSNNSTSFPSPSQSAGQSFIPNSLNASAASPSLFANAQQNGSFNDLLNQLYKSYQDQHKINLGALQARVSRPASPTHFPHHFHPYPPPLPNQPAAQSSTQHPLSHPVPFSSDEVQHTFHHQPQQQQHQQYVNPGHQKDEDHQPMLSGAHSQLQPVPSLAVGDHLHAILRAKFESSQLVSASEGWDWELGWAKLESWMDATVSEASKERISAPLRIFRPTVREILASLSKEEKILIEEGFQRLVLQMDRCFTVVRTPSLFWRRTGQIFKANNEFANLLGIDINWFKDGKLGIYELMTEDSAVNFWEQYCAIGFDTSRKAVLTTCTLCPPARLLKRNAAALAAANAMNSMSGSSSNTTNTAGNILGPGGSSSTPVLRRTGKEISCCFSFTVIRDQWGIPLGVSGQVMRI